MVFALVLHKRFTQIWIRFPKFTGILPTIYGKNWKNHWTSYLNWLQSNQNLVIYPTWLAVCSENIEIFNFRRLTCTEFNISNGPMCVWRGTHSTKLWWDYRKKIKDATNETMTFIQNCPRCRSLFAQWDSIPYDDTEFFGLTGCFPVGAPTRISCTYTLMENYQ